MGSQDQPIQLIDPEGTFHPEAVPEELAPYIAAVDEQLLRTFYSDMVSIRAFDNEATALQRQGQMALWPQSLGQEAAQVGSGRAARPQDRIFPSYREHVVAKIRGVDTINIIRMMRGLTHGGWNPDEFNMQPYTLVLAAQVLHSTGYAMGVRFDGKIGTGDPEVDEAVLVYFGDGSTSEGDLNESLVFAASYQTPQVFFLQNNHLAISVPVTRQSRTPLYLRPRGFGIPSVRVDGNDVLASYAVTAKYLDDARAGRGPRFIEALTYRMGAHTTSDDPTRYEDKDLVANWAAKDPIVRFEAYLRSLDFDQSFFDEVAEEAHDYAEDIRKRTVELGELTASSMFDNVYTDPHPVTAAQRDWLQQYEASMGAGE